jgi:hypothetical protein|eukprot:SAG25_NODE_597_length_6663_cov_3.810938_6_plen_50_part_00
MTGPEVEVGLSAEEQREVERLLSLRNDVRRAHSSAAVDGDDRMVYEKTD